jgi:hypothetical protein
MNDKRDFDRALARWLDEGSDATPPEVIDAVLLAARRTPQERDLRILWRTSPMAMYLGSAAVIVTLLVAGAAAFYAFGSGRNVGSEVMDTPSIPPETEAAFDVALHYYADETDEGGFSGVLTRVPELTRIHARLPDGWVATESGMTMASGEAQHSLAISFWAVDAVFIEPCHSDERADPPMMQTLDMLAGAFTGWWQGDAPDWGDPASPPRDLPSTTEPVPTTVSGFRAQYLEVRVPDDVDTDECIGGRYTTWRNADGVERHHQPGDVSRIWIVEVGPPPPPCCPSTSTPLLVIDATSQGEPLQEGLTGLAEIIDSLRIEAPPEETR